MLIESLESRQLLSATVCFDASSGTLAINYSSDNTGNTLNVAEGVQLNPDGSVTPTAAGTVQVFDFNQASLQQVPLGAGTYTNVKHIIINGGNGNDNISFNGSTLGAVINGGNGDDNIYADEDINTFYDPTTGNPIAHQGSAIDGGNGNDTIVVVDPSGTVISGGNNDDTIGLLGTGEYDVVDAGNGNDTLVLNGNFSDSIIDGGNGNDTINNYGIQTDVIIDGGNGKDTFTNYVDASNLHNTLILSATNVPPQ